MPQATYGRRGRRWAQATTGGSRAQMQCFASSSPAYKDDDNDGDDDDQTAREEEEVDVASEGLLRGLGIRGDEDGPREEGRERKGQGRESLPKRTVKVQGRPREALDERDTNVGAGAADGNAGGLGKKQGIKDAGKSPVPTSTRSKPVPHEERIGRGARAPKPRVSARKNPQHEPDHCLVKSPETLATPPPPRRRHRDRPKPALTNPPDAQISAHISPLLALCTSQTAPTPFATYAAALSTHLSITKIAEASYGEVYRLTPLDASLTLHLPRTGQRASVLKLIALKPPPDEVASADGTKKRTRKQIERIADMTSVADMATELRLLQRMSPIPGFAIFRSAQLLQGPVPPAFVQAWRDWDGDVKRSEFPDPGKRGSGYLGQGQLWAAIEMADAGSDLEDMVVEGGVWEVWDLFWGVAVAVGKGEAGVGFEHRDLHLGNVCARYPPAGGGGGGDGSRAAGVDVVGKRAGFTGVEVTLIDYTLSRARMDTPHSSSASETSVLSPTRPPPPSRSPKPKPKPKPKIMVLGVGERDDEEADDEEQEEEEEGEEQEDGRQGKEEEEEEEEDQDIAYLALSDPSHASLFTADAANEYQYAIYRYMRNAVLTGEPLSTITPAEKKRRDDEKPKRQRQRQRQKGKASAQAQREEDPWRAHHPITNLVWLHYILHKLLEQLSEPLGAARPSSRRSPDDEEIACLERRLICRVRELEGELALEGLGGRSRRWGVGGMGEDGCEEEGQEGVGGARGLVEWAVGRGWFEWEDVLGFAGADEGEEEEECDSILLEGVGRLSLG